MEWKGIKLCLSKGIKNGFEEKNKSLERNKNSVYGMEEDIGLWKTMRNGCENRNGSKEKNEKCVFLWKEMKMGL